MILVDENFDLEKCIEQEKEDDQNLSNKSLLQLKYN